MNDLISRSALMNHIENQSRQWGEDYDAEQILGDIEDAPTAYDVDKVVEQLQKQVDYYRAEARKNDNFPQIQHCRRLSERAYRNAIEIVKSGGGVNE